MMNSKQRQSQATQARLLEAAFEEFQRHGLAGGRVDRIAERARANKRLIYIYFGDKEQLFDTVVVRDLEAMVDSVAFSAEDLAGYAVGLFDYLEERPQALRLFQWHNLERTATSEMERAAYKSKVAEIAKAQRAGLVDPSLPAVDLHTLALGAVQSWALSSAALRAVANAREASRASRRRSLHQTITRLSAPPPKATGETAA